MDGGADSNALSAAARWIAALLTGSIGTSACVLGIAVLGFLMLSGHVPARRGGAAIIGCFIILSAASIGDGIASRPGVTAGPLLAAPAPPPLANGTQPYDPYAFAAVRQ